MADLFAGKKILVVDDEPDLREILRDELEFAGANLTEAENGQQALALASTQKFDAIISDIRMPGGDGLTLAKNIKGQEGLNPVMFLVTGFADVAPAEAFDIGVEGFIYKPFNLGPVMENLSRALLDADKRWSQPAASSAPIPVPKKLALPGTLKELIASGQISMGRGGAFVKGSFSDLRVQDVVVFDFPDVGNCTGTVKWIQHDTDSRFQAGIGIEFLVLSEVARKFALEQIAQSRPKAFIPRK